MSMTRGLEQLHKTAKFRLLKPEDLGILEDIEMKRILTNVISTLANRFTKSKEPIMSQITRAQLEQDLAAIDSLDKPEAEKRILKDLVQSQINERSGEEMPAPVESAPVEETPVIDAPVEGMPVEETPVEEAPVETLPEVEAPAPVEGEPTPVEEMPAPVEAAPIEETPVDTAPTEPTPAPTEETPVIDVPADAAPVEEAPVEAKAQWPTDEEIMASASDSEQEAAMKNRVLVVYGLKLQGK